MPRTENIVIRTDRVLKEQVEDYAKERMMAVSELGRLLFVGLLVEKKVSG
jgi:hypothetical protein